MKARHLILMLLDISGGSIDSKTKLQKEIYFISLPQLLNIDLRFKAHYYGPYSMEVEQGLDELIGAGFVDMNHTSFGVNSERGFEVKRYYFSLSESGKRFAKILEKENQKYYKKVRKFVDKLKEIGDPDYVALSVAAKAHFILSQEDVAMTAEQIIEKANKFGWNVDNNDINIAVNILTKLELVE